MECWHRRFGRKATKSSSGLNGFRWNFTAASRNRVLEEDLTEIFCYLSLVMELSIDYIICTKIVSKQKTHLCV